MDDDEFNVVGTFDEEPIVYPDDENDGSVHVPSTVSRPPKRLRDDIQNLPPDEHFVHPIDWHMRMTCSLEEQEVKRRRMEREKELLDRVAQKIIDARMKRNRDADMAKEREDDDREDELTLIMEAPPVDGSSWTGISCEENNQRFYVRMKNFSRKTKLNRKWERNRESSLLGSSLEKLVQEAARIREEKEARIAQLMEEDEEDMARDGLWVDKYQPNKFQDLLSDQTINRHLMMWIRLWDEIVFKRPVPIFDLDDKEASVYVRDEGKLKRPLYKVVLLSGPAGLGKTTLASVVARQAGYASINMNASDNRNVPDMEKVVEGAIRTTRTLHRDPRPNCLIIDEVDGAPVETIRFLVKLLSESGKKAIRRPIICICNNLYTPALRDLRNIALNLQMTATKVPRMVDRLREIASREDVRVDGGVLDTLVHLSNDIRLAINTLQYVAIAARSRHKAVTMQDVQQALEKNRLSTSSVFQQWSTVLEWTRHHDSKGRLVGVRDRLAAVEKVASDDAERLLRGLHHNYLRFTNLLPGVMAEASVCFSFWDLLFSLIHRSMDFSLFKYSFVVFDSLHLLIASHSKAQLQFPSQLQSIAQKEKESSETVACIRSRLSSLMPSVDLVQDILPLLVPIVQPPIRSVNTRLYTKSELSLIESVVGKMRHYGITYVPVTVDGVIHYSFSPPIDVLVYFDVLDSARRRILPDPSRKMIAHEISLSTMRFSTPVENSSQSQAPPTHTVTHKEVIKKHPVVYKFHDFYSNAVKRRVKMCQLLA